MRPNPIQQGVLPQTLLFRVVALLQCIAPHSCAHRRGSPRAVRDRIGLHRSSHSLIAQYPFLFAVFAVSSSMGSCDVVESVPARSMPMFVCSAGHVAVASGDASVVQSVQLWIASRRVACYDRVGH